MKTGSVDVAQVRMPAWDFLHWKHAGRIAAVYQYVVKEPAPRRVTEVQAITNYGLAGDRHASPSSPRQLLLAEEAAYQKFRLPESALRENLRINASTAEFHSGTLLRIGTEVVLWITFHCEPCSLLERRCPGTVKTIGQQRGVLARVLQGGLVSQGDEIWATQSSIPAISDDWRTRVLNVARALPPDHWLSYRSLAEMAGVATAYCRAFPRVLAHLPSEIGNRIHSAAKSMQGPQWNGAGLFDTGSHLCLPSSDPQAVRGDAPRP